MSIFEIIKNNEILKEEKIHKITEYFKKIEIEISNHRCVDISVFSAAAEENLDISKISTDLCLSVLSLQYNPTAVLPLICAVIYGFGKYVYISEKSDDPKICLENIQNKLTFGWSNYFEKLTIQLSYLKKCLENQESVPPGAHSASNQCFGAVIEVFGPICFVKAVEMNIELPVSDKHFLANSKSWGIPLLRNHASKTEAKLFIQHFLPLSDRLRAAAAAHKIEKSMIEASKLSLLADQVLQLLPSFCTDCLDLEEVMGGASENEGILPNLLAKWIKENDTLLIEIACRSLIALFTPSEFQNFSSEARLDIQNIYCNILKKIPGRKKVLLMWSDKFLPILFSYFERTRGGTKGLEYQSGMTDCKTRNLVKKTIECLSALATPARLEKAVKNISVKFLSLWSEIENTIRPDPPGGTTGVPGGDGVKPILEKKKKIICLVDLITILVPYLPKSSMCSVANLTGPMLLDPITCRCSYNLLSKILRREIEGARPLVLVNIEAFKELWKTLRVACDGASKSRMAVLKYYVDLLTSEQAKRREIPELLLSFKESNTEVRQTASSVLKSLALLYNDENIIDLFSVTAIGLTSVTANLKSSTLTALGRLLFSYSNMLTEDQRINCFSLGLLLLQDLDKSVYSAALKYLKVVVFVLEPEHLKKLVGPALSWALNNENAATGLHVIRRIIEGGISILGIEFMESIFPAEHINLLSHIRKEISKKSGPRGVRRDSIMTDIGSNSLLRPSRAAEKYSVARHRRPSQRSYIGGAIITESEEPVNFADSKCLYEGIEYSNFEKKISKKDEKKNIKKKKKEADESVQRGGGGAMQPYAYLKLNKSKKSQNSSKSVKDVLKKVKKKRNNKKI
eukprot:GHVL01035686.1.p1 GENE.GHVL01035686.1~~GHVL01035686.1.p1  ORF type:complete len:856 (+),score=184.47 GHVL01035686.1:618-3185(+)